MNVMGCLYTPRTLKHYLYVMPVLVQLVASVLPMAGVVLASEVSARNGSCSELCRVKLWRLGPAATWCVPSPAGATVAPSRLDWLSAHMWCYWGGGYKWILRRVLTVFVLPVAGVVLAGGGTALWQSAEFCRVKT